jgi:hypothetical protein
MIGPEAYRCSECVFFFLTKLIFTSFRFHSSLVDKANEYLMGIFANAPDAFIVHLFY